MSRPLTPSYTGFIGSTKDAVLVIQAVLAGDFPLVDHRPQDKERADLIKSGNVFVFIEELSGIKRWTDGISWSASRILGRFLVYRELDPASVNEKDDKRKRRKHLDLAPSLRHNSAYDFPEQKMPDYRNPVDLYRARDLAHRPDSFQPAPRQYTQPTRVMEDRSLIKKTLLVTTGAKDEASLLNTPKQTIHLISYYLAHDVLLGKLTRPSHGSLKSVSVPLQLWEAVKRSSLGGKIPIEDEAYYYLDSNYQLQNMSVMSNEKALPMRRAVPLSRMGTQSKLPYVLPVPFLGPAPPITFHADYVPPFQSKQPKEEEPEISLYQAPLLGYNVKYGNYPDREYQMGSYDHQSHLSSLQSHQSGLQNQLSSLHNHQSGHPSHPHHGQHPPSSESLHAGQNPHHQPEFQESTYAPAFPGQYPTLSYQMYNNAYYLGQPVHHQTQPSFSQPNPGQPNLTQLNATLPSASMTQTSQPHHGLLINPEMSQGDFGRGRYFGSSTTTKNSEYPDYYHSGEEPYNYN